MGDEFFNHATGRWERKREPVTFRLGSVKGGVFATVGGLICGLAFLSSGGPMGVLVGVGLLGITALAALLTIIRAFVG